METFKPENNKKKPPEEVLGEKLFIPRSLEGDYDEKPLRIMRELDMKLEKEEMYVGLVVFGSSVEGYYSVDESDLDLYLMYDSSLDDDKKHFKKLKDIVSGHVQQAEEKHQKQIRVANWFFSDINPEKIIANLQADNNKITNSAIIRLAELAGLSVGKKIENYRNTYADYLQSLPREEQIMFKNGMVDFKIKGNEKTHAKRIERNEAFPPESKDEYLQSRRELWMKRVEKIYGI